jgi:1-acyl-sn-glycerol-3-phosphate acyltransferase
MRPFGLDNWWRKFGAVDQTYLNFDRILARGGRVIYYPEGIPGIGKGFNRRYRLQRFQPSFVKLAARYNVPVLPVYGINAEWINPANLTFRWIDRLSSRLLGIPFIPLPLIILAVFPFFFLLCIPVQYEVLHWKAGRCARDRIRDGASPESPTATQAEQVAEKIRQEMQRELEAGGGAREKNRTILHL